MKTNMHRHTSKLIALAGLLAGAVTLPGFAQPVVNTTINAVGGVTGGLGVGAGSSAGGAIGGSIGGVHSGSGAAAGGAFGGAVTPADVRASGAFETIGMRQERLAAQADVAQRQIATTTLRAGPSAAEMRAMSVDSRARMTADIDERIATSSQAMATMKAQSKSLRGDAQAEFKSAAKDVDAREKELRTSVKAARRATPETWAESRANVAANYEAYTQAVGHAEAIAAANATAKPGR